MAGPGADFDELSRCLSFASTGTSTQGQTIYVYLYRIDPTIHKLLSPWRFQVIYPITSSLTNKPQPIQWTLVTNRPVSRSRWFGEALAVDALAFEKEWQVPPEEKKN